MVSHRGLVLTPNPLLQLFSVAAVCAACDKLRVCLLAVHPGAKWGLFRE